MRTRHHSLLSCVALFAALCVTAHGARAQGKSHDKEQHGGSAKHETSAKQETHAKNAAGKATEHRAAEHGVSRAVRPEPARVARVDQVKVERGNPGHGKKVITTDRAIVVTREVLVKHGYEVVRIETVRGARVVYYRRGNMGRGRGKGPIVRMVIRPVEERVVFEQAPRGLLAEINVRLGM